MNEYLLIQSLFGRHQATEGETRWVGISRLSPHPGPLPKGEGGLTFTERQADSLRYNSFHADSANLFGASNWRRGKTPHRSGEWLGAPRARRFRGAASVVA